MSASRIILFIYFSIFYLPAVNMNARGNWQTEKAKSSDKKKITDKDKGSGWGTSLAPLFGVDDRAGGRIGAAVYFYRESPGPGLPGLVAGLMVSGLIGVKLDLRLVDLKDWDIRTRSIFSRDDEIYYGEGPATSVRDPLRVYGDRFEFDTAVMCRIFEDVTFGVDLTLRARKQRDVKQENIFAGPAPDSVIPNEIEAGAGLRVEWDNRDQLLSPSRGRFLQFRVLFFPPEWSNRLRSKENFSTQFQIDYRHFQKIAKRLVWANRGWAGASVGGLGYQYRYTLGGNRRLRGYGSNRFRGDHVYLYQSELRWRVWDKYLFFVGSVGTGGVVDEGKTKLQFAKQLGLRIALPPNWGWKVRLEMGWGSDQKNFIIHVGETF